MQNVPVAFSISGGLIEETLASGGAPLFTDSSGQALDTLYTRAPIGGVQKSVDGHGDRRQRRSPRSVTVFID